MSKSNIDFSIFDNYRIYIDSHYDVISMPSKVYILPSGRVLGLCANGYIVFSDDNGATWDFRKIMQYNQEMTLHILDNNRILIIYESGSALSTDEFETFTDTSNIYMEKILQTTKGYIFTCQLDSNNLRYLARSKDNGQTWEQLPDALIENYLYDIKEATNGNIVIATKGFSCSEDDGDTWHKTSRNYYPKNIVVTNGGIIIGPSGQISKDNGVTWDHYTYVNDVYRGKDYCNNYEGESDIGTLLDNNFPLCLIEEKNIYVSGLSYFDMSKIALDTKRYSDSYSAEIITTNNATPLSIDNGVNPNSYNCVNRAYINNDNVLVAVARNKVYASIDKGQTWETVYDNQNDSILTTEIYDMTKKVYFDPIIFVGNNATSESRIDIEYPKLEDSSKKYLNKRGLAIIINQIKNSFGNAANEYIGSEEAWNALTTEEQNAYNKAYFV